MSAGSLHSYIAYIVDVLPLALAWVKRPRGRPGAMKLLLGTDCDFHNTIPGIYVDTPV